MKLNTAYIIILFLGLMLMAACSPLNQYKVLSFVFDGVPDPTEQGADSSLVAENPIQEDLVQKTVSKQPALFVHEPYKGRECTNCHDAVNKSKLNEKQPDLCYQCHEDFKENYAVLHGPVAGGFCTECHSPHSSKLNKLLLRKGQSLCLNCHDSWDVFKNENHDGIEETDCIECHNPHGGEDRFVLQ